MGQKVNPHGLRVGVIKDWDSRWFARDNAFGDILVEDYNLRKFLKKKLYDAGVPKIEIERTADKVRINIHCARPGIVIGKGGAEIEKLRAECEALVNKGKTQKLTVLPLGVIEVKSPDKNAQLVAENIAAQLEGRVSFRRAMKQAIGRAMKPMGREPGAKGIKTSVSGRLGGAEKVRTDEPFDFPVCQLFRQRGRLFAAVHRQRNRIGMLALRTSFRVPDRLSVAKNVKMLFHLFLKSDYCPLLPDCTPRAAKSKRFFPFSRHKKTPRPTGREFFRHSSFLMARTSLENSV